jgi:hypothetical protein
LAIDPYAPPKAADQPVSPDDSAFAVSILCRSCSANIRIGDDVCPGCRRTVTRDQKRALQDRWEGSDRDVARASEDTYWARASLAIAATVATIQAAFLLAVPALAIAGFGVAFVLWVLFVLGFRTPLGAGVAGLTIYVLVWLGQAVFVPPLAFDGLLMRILILSALAAGIAAEWKLRRRRLGLVRARDAEKS